MGGNSAAGLIALLLLVAAGIVSEAYKRTRRDEILPPSKVREFTRRLANSHENLRKQSKKR
jgi:hypothetical protein